MWKKDVSLHGIAAQRTTREMMYCQRKEPGYCIALLKCHAINRLTLKSWRIYEL